MPDLQGEYDDAMFDYSRGDYDSAIAKFKAVLAAEPAHFDAQLSLAMAHYRKGDYATAIAETWRRFGWRPVKRDAQKPQVRPRTFSQLPRTWKSERATNNGGSM